MKRTASNDLLGDGMKLETYSIGKPVSGVCRQYAIWATEGSTTSPIVYLQRPKWITDDAAWERIVKSIRLDLPNGFNVT